MSCPQSYPPLLPPSLEHPLGTDPLGRDALCALLSGTPFTLEASLAAFASSFLLLSLASFLGTTKPSLAYSLSSFLSSLPRIPLLVFLALIVKLDPVGIGLLVGTLSSSLGLETVASLAEDLSSKPFYLASLASGASRFRAWLSHVMPNSLPSILSFCALSASVAIYAEAGASMLGLEDPSLPSVGKLAYLVFVTPGAVLTEAGLVQVLASALTASILAYAVYTVIRKLSVKNLSS